MRLTTWTRPTAERTEGTWRPWAALGGVWSAAGDWSAAHAVVVVDLIVICLGLACVLEAAEWLVLIREALQ